jgi:hypothetical protein
MDNQTVVVIVIVALIVAAIAAWLYVRSRRTSHLRSRFGPEYDRVVEEIGARGKAEANLHNLEKRVRKFDIRPLGTTDRDRFIVAWRDVQAMFVDNPERAVNRADQLLGDIMEARGYPVGDFDQQAADLSVDHPVVVDNYRTAHEIVLRQGQGQATTEDLRQAMVRYRTLFDELTADHAPPAPAGSDSAARDPEPAPATPRR